MAPEISPESPKYVYSGYDTNSDTNISDDEASKSSEFKDKKAMADTAFSNVDSLFTTAKQNLNTAQLKAFGEKQKTVADTLKTRATNYASGALSQFSIMDSKIAVSEGQNESACTAQAKNEANTNIASKCAAYQELVNNFMTRITNEEIAKLDKEVKDVKEEKPAAPPVEGVGETPANEKVDETPTETEWTAEKKAQPRRLKMTVAFSFHTGAATGTVVTPDGKTYIENVSASAYYSGKFSFREGLTIDSAESLSQLNSALQTRLKGAGWTNVTLENQKFNWSSDGSQATGKVEKPETKDVDKTEHHDLTISFAVHTMGFYDGSASVTTPDGELHQVTTGASLSAKRARQDLANKMRELLQNRGWSDITLKNDNFNDWS